MSISPEQLKVLLLGSIPPFFIGAIVFFFLAPKSAPEPDATGKLPRPRHAWVLPVLLCALMFIFQPLVAGKFVLYPRSASEWPLLTALISTVLALVALSLPRPRALRLLARFGAIVTLGGFVAQTIFFRWSLPEKLAWLGLLGAFATTAWFSLSHIVTLNKGISGIGILALFTLAAAVACEPGFSSLPSAQAIGIISWALLGGAAVALIRPNLRLAENATHVPVFVASMITFAASIGAGEDPAWLKVLFGALVALVPTLPFLLDAIWKPASPSKGRTFLHLAVAAIPFLVLAAIAGKRAMDALAADPYVY
ncbi:MAG: hypothetical protein KF805_16445 [Phycisphaeraceae bacterium]|nr:hypothetical protein [Phycisphaeraceae bacterium]